MTGCAQVTRIEAPRSIFVLKPSSLGDVVHTLPAVARLKGAWPAAKITWLVNSEWAPLLVGNPDVHEILPFPRQEFRGPAGWRRWYPWMRSHVLGRRPDLALDFQGLLRTALIGRLSRPRRLLGLSDAREGAPFFYHQSIPPPVTRLHAVDRYLALADAVIGPGASPGQGSPLLFPLPAGEPLEAADANLLAANYILLHPFARGAAKSLSIDLVQAFCERLHPRQVVLAGRAPASMAIPALPGTVNLLNRTSLPQLIWLLRRAAFVISVDSGPMHLAAALGRPLVAIHTWSDPRRVGPYRPEAWVCKHGRLRQVGEMLGREDEAFFQAPGAGEIPLSLPQINAICALANAPSYSCA